MVQGQFHSNNQLVIPAFIQPILSDNVAAALADVKLEAPVNGMIEPAGPEKIHLHELVRRFLIANKDTRQVLANVHARYFGTDRKVEDLGRL